MLSEVFVSLPHCVSHHPAATTRQILRFSQYYGWRIHSFGDCRTTEPLKMKVVCSFETSGHTYPIT